MKVEAGVVVLAALAPAATLAVEPGGLYPFGPAKWLAVSALVPCGAALVMRRRPLRFARWPTLALTALAGWMAVSAAFGLDPVYAWTGTPERHFGALTWALCGLAFLAGQTMEPERDGPVLVTGLALAAAGMGVVGTLEALGWEAGVLDVDSERLTATLGSSAYLGAAVALILPALIGAALDRGLPRWIRLCGAAVLLPLAVAVAGAGARAAWAGLAGSAVVVAWCQRERLAGRRREGLKVATAVAVGLAVVIVATPVGPRLASTFDTDEPGGRARLDEWRVATRVITGDPILGVGPEGYRIAFAGAVDAGYERDHGRDPLPDRAHSAPLDIAAAGGIPAVALWLAALAGLSRFVWRALAGARPWVTGAAAALVAHLAGQFLLFPTAELEPLAWLLAGVVVAASAEPAERRTQVPSRVLPSALAVVTALALVTGALDLAADRRAAAAAAALSRADGDAALEAAEAAVRLRPDEIRLRLLQARALVAADKGISRALASLEAARDVSPEDPVVALERARLLVARAQATAVDEHIEAAREEIASLLDGDPYNAALWREAGLASALDGDIDQAEQAWAQAEDLAPNDPTAPTNLALLYLETGRNSDARAAIDRALGRAPDDPRATAVRDLVEAGG